jgi:hypothetical protein
VLQRIAARESINSSDAMLIDSTRQIACHANVENAVGSIGQDINVSARIA